MKSLTVGLGNRSYRIHIEQGLLDAIGTALQQNPFAKRYAVIADERVAALFGERVLNSLHNSGLQADILTFGAGENSKNLGTVAGLASSLARMGFDRKDGLIALGGGVTGDITGFLAACYMRSIPFAGVPTTLLAQVDSSVGGKTGVDIPEGKNLVGAFYQPRAVFIDSEVLKELPESELLNGLAEVIKYGVIYDRDFFRFLERSRREILALDLQVLDDVIVRCCRIKAAVVEADERESDFRRILNFGHTIGHAVEAVSGYELAHGSAVAIGMAVAAELAVLKGIMDTREKERLVGLIRDFGLPDVIPPEYDRTRIREYLQADKKTVGGRVFFVLPTSISRGHLRPDKPSRLRQPFGSPPPGEAPGQNRGKHHGRQYPAAGKPGNAFLRWSLLPKTVAGCYHPEWLNPGGGKKTVSARSHTGCFHGKRSCSLPAGKTEGQGQDHCSATGPPWSFPGGGSRFFQRRRGGVAAD
jgi:3-dehydroquinate synthase